MGRPRKITRYFIVLDKTIIFTCDTIAEVSERIAEHAGGPDDAYTVIVGEEQPVTIDRAPRVVIGAEKPRRRKAIVNVDPVLTRPKRKRNGTDKNEAPVL
jgi:hypothetical protein